MIKRTFDEKLARFSTRDGSPVSKSALMAFMQTADGEDWDGLAPYWSRCRAVTDEEMNGARTKILRRMVDIVENPAHDVVIDCGCGDAYDLAFLGTIFPRKQFVGFDQSEGMVAVGRERIRRHGLRNVQSHLASYTDARRVVGGAQANVAMIVMPTFKAPEHTDLSTDSFVGTAWDQYFAISEKANRREAALTNVRQIVKLGGTVWIVEEICCSQTYAVVIEIARRSGLQIISEETTVLRRDVEKQSAWMGMYFRAI